MNKYQELSSDDESQKDAPQDRLGTKRKRLHWNQTLQSRFMAAIRKFGVDEATPLRIKEFLQDESITRKQIKSHLQKYRRKVRRVDQSSSASTLLSSSSVSGAVVSFSSLEEQTNEEIQESHSATKTANRDTFLMSRTSLGGAVSRNSQSEIQSCSVQSYTCSKRKWDAVEQLEQHNISSWLPSDHECNVTAGRMNGMKSIAAERDYAAYDCQPSRVGGEKKKRFKKSGLRITVPSSNRSLHPSSRVSPCSNAVSCSSELSSKELLLRKIQERCQQHGGVYIERDCPEVAEMSANPYFPLPSSRALHTLGSPRNGCSFSGYDAFNGLAAPLPSARNYPLSSGRECPSSSRSDFLMMKNCLPLTELIGSARRYLEPQSLPSGRSDTAGFSLPLECVSSLPSTPLTSTVQLDSAVFSDWERSISNFKNVS